MKTLALVLLFIAAAATAAPTTTSAEKQQHVLKTETKRILKEIIQSVKHLNNTLEDKAKEIFVRQAVTQENCTSENLCKAATVLEKLHAKTLGLAEKDWLLPRQLIGYTKLQKIQCKPPAPNPRIHLQDLLQNIHHCAQKMFAKTE